MSYGSSFEPVTLGSGGGNADDGLGGAGGGAIRIITDNLILDGRITANGIAAAGETAGGGAGGSIWITTRELSGNGQVQAVGGDGRNGGGGGRIAVYYQDGQDYQGYASCTVQGGQGYRPGQTGTAGFFDQAGGRNDLHVYQSFRPEDDPAIPVYVGDMIHLHTGSIFTIGSVNRIDANDILIETGAIIEASGLGFGPDGGPGAGDYAAQGAGGGANGGPGGRGAIGDGGAVYGWSFWPDQAGSGGGSAGENNQGGQGGGLIEIHAHKLVVDGSIVADGLNGTGQGGGGAGGTILLDSVQLSGGGSLSAKGGSSGSPFAGGGGGGRIVVYYNNADTFAGFGNVNINGGTGRMTGGKGSSAFIRRMNRNQLDLTELDIEVYNRFDLYNESGPLAYTLNRLTVHEGAVLEMAFTDSLTVNEMVMAVNARITADGTGGLQNEGTGKGQAHAEGSGGGAYGGAGGKGRMGAGGLAYGSPAWPDSAGSGGGGTDRDNTGGSGGGALYLTVKDIFNFNGTITANGLDGMNMGGGGSGGGIIIKAGTLEGAGTLHADGGNGGNPFAGGGGGGRILLQYGFADHYTGLGGCTVSGGSGRANGDDGTIITVEDDGAILVMNIEDALVPGGSVYTGPQPVVINAITPVFWTLENGPEGMTIDSQTGVVSWSNPIAALEAYQITIRATNADETGFDDESWLLSVQELPVISAMEDRSVLIGQSFTGTAPNLENEPGDVSWSLISGPVDMTINAQTGVVSWNTARLLPTGEPYTITIRASNTVGSVDVSFNLRVLDKPLLPG